MHQIVEFITRIHQTLTCDIALTLYGFACCICMAYIYGSRDSQKRVEEGNGEQLA